MRKFWTEQLFPIFYENDGGGGAGGNDDGKGGDKGKGNEKVNSGIEKRISDLVAANKEQATKILALETEKSTAETAKLEEEKKYKELSEKQKGEIDTLTAQNLELTTFQATIQNQTKAEWDALKTGIPKEKRKFFDMEGDTPAIIAANLAKHKEYSELGVLEASADDDDDNDTDTSGKLGKGKGEKDPEKAHSNLISRIKKSVGE